jgi:hypothetical protein
MSPIARFVAQGTTPDSGPDGRLHDIPGRCTDAPAGEDQRLWDELEQTLLRMEFEAIIEAAYPPAADQPRAVPPARPVRTVVGGDRPITGPPLTDGPCRRAQFRHDVTHRTGPRERGPPRLGAMVGCATHPR